MKKRMKKFVAAILVVCLAVVPYLSVPASAELPGGGTVSPQYNNTVSATAAMTISNSGLMTISYDYEGFPSKTTKAEITTYIEKRSFLLFWNRVNIGQPNNEWFDTIYNYEYTGSRTFQLSSSGTYRVHVTYKIYGTGGAADEISFTFTDSY